MVDSLVSVVIPTYNRAFCIGRAIDSVLSQTHHQVEVLVVDDGSTDGTPDMLESRYGAEPRLRVLRQENQGVSAARNTGLRSARGAFIALLDSDDIWLPWKLEAQLAGLAALPAAGMIWTDMDAVSPSGEVLVRRYLATFYGAYSWFGREELFERWVPFSSIRPDLAGLLGEPRLYVGDVFSKTVLRNLVHTSTVLLRRERLERVGGFDLALGRTGEDYDFHLRTCREGPVAYLDAASILYLRGQADQLTHGSENELQMARNFLRTIEPAIDRDRDRIRLPRIMLDEVLAEAHGWIGSVLVRRGEHLEGMRHLAASLRRKPRQPRLVGLLLLNLLPLALADGLRRLHRGATEKPVRGAGKLEGA